jgi:hypothetical protein
MMNSKQRKERESHHPLRGSRYFYSSVAVIMLAIMFAGFYPYYLHGEGPGGRTISSDLSSLVFIHGGAMTAWLMLFLVQSLLVPARKIRIHMKLGWLAIAVGLIASASGFKLAIESVRSAPEMIFSGMEYRQYLLVMLTDFAVFTLFVLAGVLFRRKREVHRAMMLLACLSVLGAATNRIPVLSHIFGHTGLIGDFGPTFILGALFLLVRFFFDRALDRRFSVGFAVMTLIHISSYLFATSDTWSVWAQAILNH